MDDWKDPYSYETRQAIDAIPGWFDLELLPVYATIDRTQKRLGLNGSVVEFGVYHGRSFAPLLCLTSPGEQAIAVDCFEQPGSDKGIDWKVSRAEFESAIASIATHQERMLILETDSQRLDADMILEHGNGPVRIFSIDGAHSASATCHDLQVAYKALHPAGVLILDDVLHRKWKGVTRGLFDFFESEEPDLIPVHAAGNKVIFCHRRNARPYRRALQHAGLPSDQQIISHIPPAEASFQSDLPWRILGN